VDLDRRLAVPTPEGLFVDMRAAGPASRAIAALVDHLIAALVVVLVAVAARSVDSTFPIEAALVIPVGIAVLFVLEAAGAGRSPGKRMVGLRVVRPDGTPPGPGALLVRNVLRLADVLPATVGIPVPYGVGAISTVVSDRGQRLGDHAAGTLVVWEKAGDRSTPTSPSPLPQLGAPPSWAAPRWLAPSWPPPGNPSPPSGPPPSWPPSPGNAPPPPGNAPPPPSWPPPGNAPPPSWPPAGNPPPPAGWPPPSRSPAANVGPPHAPPEWDVRWVDPVEVAIARRFLARRASLTPASRSFLAAQLRSRLGARAVGAPTDLPAEPFIEQVVARRSVN
jgi:uncharacterized RDD family membrane protein YckC